MRARFRGVAAIALTAAMLMQATAAAGSFDDFRHVSEGIDGADAGGDPGFPSADGMLVAFRSGSSNLVAGDTNDTSDVFVRDVVAGTTQRVSVASDGTEANDYSALLGMSDDGRYVLFSSQATTLADDDDDSAHDLYLRDRAAGTTTRVTPEEQPIEGWFTNPRSVVHGSLSGDGRFVVFASNRNLLDGDNNDDTGARHDLFLYDTSAESLSLLTTGPNGGDVTLSDPVLSADGRFVTYADGEDHVWVHDRVRGSDTRVSGDVGDWEHAWAGDHTAVVGGRWVTWNAYLSQPGYAPYPDGGAPGDAVVVFDLESGERQIIAAAEYRAAYPLEYRDPVVSRDGRFTVFAREDLLGVETSIRMFDRLTGRTTELGETPGQTAEHRPYFGAFSADGQHLTFDQYTVSDGHRSYVGRLAAISRFRDVASGSVFVASIERLADAGITQGCNPPDNDRFCPSDSVTRAQMAAFLDRALDLPEGTAEFGDVPAGHTFAASISALADAGITQGCNPPDSDRFCPSDSVTRAQMAAFLDRADLTG